MCVFLSMRACALEDLTVSHTCSVNDRHSALNCLKKVFSPPDGTFLVLVINLFIYLFVFDLVGQKLFSILYCHV